MEGRKEGQRQNSIPFKHSLPGFKTRKLICFLCKESENILGGYFHGIHLCKIFLPSFSSGFSHIQKENCRKHRKLK